jgi:hypothetical protein
MGYGGIDDVFHCRLAKKTNQCFEITGSADAAQGVLSGRRYCTCDSSFTPNLFPDGMMLAQSLRNSDVELEIEQVSPGTLHGSVKGVRVTFLQYQYPLLKPLEQWDEMNCPLASLEDLACMKLSAIAQRGARKDFCDIYALGKKAFSLSQMLGFYQKKFSIGDIGSVLYGMVYFDDAESERMPRMLWDVTWREIRNTILGWVKEVS